MQLRLQGHDPLGPGHGRHARRRGRRQARHQRPRRHQPRHPHPPRQLVLRQLGRPGDVRDQGPARATRSTATTRGTSTRSRSPRSATSTTSTAGSCRPAGSTAPTTSPSTPAAARSPGCGRRRCPASSTSAATSRRPGTACVINLPKTALKPEVTFEWKIPQWSNTIERNRARTYFQAYAAAAALHFVEKALAEVRAGQHQDVGAVRGARRGHRLRVHRGRAGRAVAPHGDQGRQDRQLPPVPADAVERQPARHLRHARARTRTR